MFGRRTTLVNNLLEPQQTDNTRKQLRRITLLKETGWTLCRNNRVLVSKMLLIFFILWLFCCHNYFWCPLCRSYGWIVLRVCFINGVFMTTCFILDVTRRYAIFLHSLEGFYSHNGVIKMWIYSGGTTLKYNIVNYYSLSSFYIRIH